MTESELTPPQNLEAEKAVLGSCMLGGKVAILEAQTDLVSTDFYLEAHRVIFENILEIDKQNKPVDMVTLSEALGSSLHKVGGRSYIIALANSVPNANNIKHYVDIVKNKSIIRQQIREWQVAIQKLQEEEEPEDVISSTINESQNLIKSKISSSILHAKDIGIKVFEEIGERKEANGIPGLPTGFKDLDLLIGGMRKGKYILLAGRSSMGKSTMALSITNYVSTVLQKRTLFLSFEMTSEELMEKLLALNAEIDGNKLLNIKHLNDDDWARLGKSLNIMSESKLHIAQPDQYKVSDVVNCIKCFNIVNPIDLVVIDYINKLEPIKRTGNGHQEMTEISKMLKRTSLSLKVPFIVLCQLSRRVEERGDKRPVMSDLRESGSLEDDADMVWLLYREDYYKPEMKPDYGAPSLTEMNIAKNRGGPTGVIDFQFFKEKSRFFQVDSKHIPPKYHITPKANTYPDSRN